MSEIRYDKLKDTHVIIAPERLHRPDHNLDIPIDDPHKHCPFCEGNESMTPPEIFALRHSNSFANESNWHTRVVPNLYKALQIETEHQHHFGTFEHWEGFGAHEVIIDTPKHHTSMTQFSAPEINLWLKTLRARVVDLRHDDRLAYISLFKNDGSRAGATQTHAHTQLLGLPIVPKSDQAFFHRSFEHFKETGTALIEMMIAHEIKDERRIIAKEGEFVAFAPFASAYPFEVMISSQKALGQIDTLSDTSIESLSYLLANVLKRLKQQLDFFDFNLTISTPPLKADIYNPKQLDHVDQALRFSLHIMPRLYRHGGFELASGMMINPVTPERAAKLLRESAHV